MALLTVNPVSKAGVVDISAVMVAAAAGGDSVVSADGLLVVLTNADGGAHTLTVAAPAASANCGNLGALDVDPITLAVAAGKTGFLTIPAGYKDGSSSNYVWTYDDETGLTVGVFSLAP